MKNLTQYFGLILLLSIFGCSQNSESAGMRMAAEEDMAAPAIQQKIDESVERKLIKEGRVEFETDDLSGTRKNIYKAVSTYKAYISSDEEYNSPGRKSNTVVIRAPADHFDNLLKDATQGIERFDSKQINVKDVTEEFLDIQARLKTKKELEKRYLELLKQANKVTDILEVEKQIGQLRSDIESIEGRLQYLQNKVSFSTLSMTFYERIPDHTQFGKKFKNGFRNGWENLIWFFVALTNIWPFILIVIGLIIGLRIYFRKKK